MKNLNLNRLIKKINKKRIISNDKFVLRESKQEAAENKGVCLKFWSNWMRLLFLPLIMDLTQLRTELQVSGGLIRKN